MKIGIIGPNSIDKETDKRKEQLSQVAEIVAVNNHEIVLTPDKNSLLEYFGHKYEEFGGKRIWIVAPLEEADGNKHLNTELGEVIVCKDWDNQADEFNRQSDIFVCVGYAWGAMKEIACAQYFGSKKIYILEEFVSGKLPEELNFLVEYISLEDLANILNNSNNHHLLRESELGI